MSDFTDMTARAEQADSSLYLGRLAWYAITEGAYVDHAEFCRDLLDNNLLDHLPPAPRSSDVFKRAATAAQVRHAPVLIDMGAGVAPGVESDKFMNILIREVGKDADNIWRHVVVETVDTNGHSLDYSECVAIHYDRTTQQIDHHILKSCGKRPEVQAVVKNVEDLYTKWYNMLTPYAVRELIRKCIRTLGSTALRDGVYFVKEEHADKVEALERVVAGLPAGSNFHSLPLIDDRKQRAMLKQAFEDESIGEIDRILGEITELRKAEKKITSDRFADYKVEYDRLRKKVLDYSNLLDEAMEGTASRLEIMDQAIFGLMGNIKV